MIRSSVGSQWLQKSCGFLNASASRRASSLCPLMCGHSLLRPGGPPWLVVDSPPTTCCCNRCQGRIESAKRSLANLGRGHPVPLYSGNNRVADFASDARFMGSADSHAQRKFRIKKTKVGRLLEANPVVRMGQRKNRKRGRPGLIYAHQVESLHEGNEFDYEIDIHSPEGALQEGFPTDDELNESLFTAHSNVGSHRRGKLPQKHSSDHDSSDLNEFDKQYFSDAVHNKFTSSPIQGHTSHARTLGVAPSEEMDVDDTNEFDQQYFGNLQHTDDSSHIFRDGMQDRRLKALTSSQKNLEPAYTYMDTSTPEGHLENLTYGARTQEAMKDFDKKLGKLFEDAGQDKSISLQSLFDFEPHETATEFQRLEDGTDHEDISFENEMKLGEDVAESIPTGPLKAKLEAERIVAQKEEELRIGDHNLSDLEPGIIKAMKAVWQAKADRKVKTKTQTGQKVFGSPDPSLPATDVSCSGCGARFQGYNPKLPGFLPSEKFRELVEGGGLERAVCQRCWYLTHHQMALDVSIGASDYGDIITSIRKKKALVVVLVDLLDFPCSLIPNLKGMVGERKPMVIVGNKADLLPRDSWDWNKRITKQLLQACVDAGVCSEDNVKHVCIISAKSGFGIEDLITALQRLWGTTDDVYLLGTANVGKSTLFNRLLNSDYCKAKASWLISKATISRWPGTTLNLLKFPIVKPTAEKMALRSDRLSAERKQTKAEEERRKMLKREDKTKVMDEEAYVRGSVGRSYDIVIKEEEKELDDSTNPFSLTLGKVKSTAYPPPKGKKSGREQLPFSFTPEEFDKGRWFYDTPGMIHDQQILTKLTIDELKLVVPKKAILPKTIILKPGNTIFMGGIGRLDYLEGHKAAFFTIFASKALPIRVFTTAEADNQYQALVSSDRIKVPLGGTERMKTFPALQPVEMTVTGTGWDCSAADVLFSSAGWAAVTAAQGMEVHLRAHTPGGYGCLLRRPALLPFVVNMRGDRMAKKSPFFKVNRQKLMHYL